MNPTPELREEQEFQADLETSPRQEGAPAEQNGAQEGENSGDWSPRADFDILPVVGLGGSAGGIAALQEFFGAMNPDSGSAFVVVMHLAPDAKSQLQAVIQYHTPMPVVAVTGETKVEANHVYVIPPGHHLAMEDGHLRLEPLENEFGKRVAVDLFFRTLASSHRSRAVAVVLSGMDSDGAVGIKRIKEMGGVTVVQALEEAEYEGMPRAALNTGMVDWVLPVAQIAARLSDFARNEARIRDSIGAVADREPRVKAEGAQADETALRDILSYLYTRTRRDFTHYKRATVLRRVMRRLQVNALSNLPDYLHFLRLHAGEAGALLQDLLISVTNFFRDPEAFGALELHIPTLFRNKTTGDTVRVWVSGCATGEEAYSLAMMLVEYADTLASPPSIQLFATDIDEEALRVARDGRYPQAIAADVSPERLRRFFTLDHGLMRVRPDLRDMVLFAVHNLLGDAPFSRMDLISCRNLLIYFEREAQEKALGVFHFSLKPEGTLFLGSSESPDGVEMFAPLDKKHRLYSRRSLPRAVAPIPVFTPPPPLEIPKVRQLLGAVSLPQLPPPPSLTPNSTSSSFGELHLQMLEMMAPPSVLVNAEYDILHLSPEAGKFLIFAGGSATTNLLSVAQPSLRLELRAALFRALRNGEDVRVRPLREVGRDDGAIYYLLVVFEEKSDEAALSPVEQVERDDVAHGLNLELNQMKAYLRQTVEQYEATTEELKASNEELQAVNEELRSAGEELETSREELQATNEELLTVNAEMRGKVEQISQSNADLNNLISSTDIATVFLDRQLCVKRYTPRALDLFRLEPTDLGRRLSDLRNNLELDDEAYIEDAERVLDQLSTLEREVRTRDGRFYLLRVSPYRTGDNRIDGVVLTFVDITERKRVESSRFHLASIVESSQDSMLTVDLDGVITSWNQAAQALYGYGAGEVIGQPLTMLTLPADLAQVLQNADKVRNSEKVEIYDTVRINRDGREMNLEVVLSPVKNSLGEVIGLSTIARDVTQRRQAVEALRQSEEKYRSLFDSMDEGYCILQMLYDEAGQPNNFRYLEVNPAFEKQTGLTDATGKTILEMAPGIEPEWTQIYGRVAETGESIRFEETSPTLDARTFDLYCFRVGEPEERRVAVLFTDISERKRREWQQAFLLKLNDALRPLSDPAQIQRAAMRVVGESLGVDRAMYAEISPDGETTIVTDNYLSGRFPAFTGEFPLAAYGSIIDRARQGEPLVVADVDAEIELSDAEKTNYKAIGSTAFVTIPLIKDGRWVSNLVVHQGEPRRWTDEEIAVLQETAERTWAAVERARAQEALRASEAWLAGQKEALQAAVNGAPLETSLGLLVRTAVEQSETQVRCGFYLANEAQTELFHVVGMGEAYRDCVDGFKIGADSLACGLAIYTNHPVITPDVTQDPRWKDWEWMAQKHEFRGVWSFPIETTEGKVVGTFAQYFAAPREATQRDFEFAANLTRTAAIIISRTQEAQERARAEALLRASEEKYRSLFDTMDEGLAINEIVRDASGRAVDARYLELNPAYERQTGFKRSDAIGRLATETFPAYTPMWLEVAERVLKTGQPERIEQFVADNGKWFAFHITPFGGEDGFTVFFDDITERKFAEERREFLLKLSDALRPLAGAVEIKARATQLLGQQLGVNRAYYAEVAGDDWLMAGGYAQGVPPLAEGRAPMEPFGNWIIDSFRAGQRLVIRDVRTDARFDPSQQAAHEAIQILGAAAVPLVKDGALVAILVAQNATPRDWNEQQMWLIQETAERTWAAVKRARAELLVRGSEEEKALLLRLSDAIRTISDPVEIRQTAMRMLGEQLGLSRAYYFEVEAEGGSWVHVVEQAFAREDSGPSMIGRHSLADFNREMFAALDRGEVVAVPDVAARTGLSDEEKARFRAIDIAAFINVPLLRDGGYSAGIAAHSPAPREWTAGEISLIREVAARMWTSIQRAHAEEELREADERFRTMADTAPVLIWETDQSGVIFTNEHYLDFFGAGFDDIRGMCWTGFLHPDDAAAYLAAYEQAFARREPFTHECRFRRADGEYRWLLNIGQPLNEVHFVGSSSDISDLKIAAKAVRESEERARALISNLPGGAAFIFDRDLRYTLAEGEALARVGMQSSDFVGRLFSEAMPPELAQKSEPLLRRLFEGEPFDEERELGGRTFLSRGVPLRDGNGEVSNALVVSYDISERKRTEVLLHESEERLRVAVDAAEMGTWTWDIERDEAFWNERHFTLFGMEPRPNPIPSRVFLDHILEDDRALVSERLRRAVETNTTFEADFRIVRDDNRETRWMSGYGHGVDLVDGRVVRMSGVMLDVTERKRAEELVRESQARLQLVVESASDYAIITQSTEGQITAWNSGAEKILGWTRDEAIGQPIALIFTPEDEASGAALLEMRTARDEGRAADERWHVRKDGSRLFMSGVLTPLCDGDETTGYVKVARDLTREQAAEAAVRKSEAQFRTLSDVVPQIIWTNEAGGVANYFNSRWFEYSGLSLKDSFGPGWQAIVHPDDAPASRDRWYEALDRGEVFDTEYRLRHRDGQYRWFIGRNVPLRDDEGQFTGWFGTATDINDLKEAEANLRESGERFRAIFEQSTVGVAEYDLDGNHIFVNETFCQSVGYSADELLALNAEDIVFPDDWPRCLSCFERAKVEEGSVTTEKRLICKTGEIIWVRDSVSAIRDENGQTRSVVAVIIDITERKLAEEELQRAHGELEVRVNRRTRELALALERVSAEVTQRRQAEAGRAELMKRIVNTQEEERGRISRELHDNLGQHLTAVMLGLQALEAQIESLTGDKRQQQAPQLDKLRDLVDGLMRAAHRQAWELRPAELDAMGLESALGQYSRDWSGQTGIEVDFQATGWDRRPAPEVETTLYRVVQEALTNVVRHANATLVSVVIERNDNTASVIIEDDGQGFDTEQSTGRLGVLGMQERLSIVNGTLDIESIPGEGTTVFARVPV